MSTCRWCTPGGSVTTDLLKAYAARELRGDDLQGANDDLSYCMECVVEYHRVREEVPNLHKVLQKLEISRLVTQLEKFLSEELEEDDELILVEEDGEKQLFGYTGPNFESNLRVPLLEILKYPYLLLNERVSELSTEALCKMEQANNSFQVYEKLPGVYLLLVNPNETIRRWAIMTARAQGKVDRDDYYELQEVFTCLFKVIELGLFENPDIYSYSEIEYGKLILLPSHLYDTTNYKNYWLGICMLLTVLEEQAMDSLLLGHDKQNDFMQSILHIMEKQTEDESCNPFWPALHCFMMILDRLGSKVWGQLIDPIQAFQTIIGSPSYNNEIENIRNSYQRNTKLEPDADYDDDMVSCSQMVYNFNTEKIKKDTGWKNAICPDYCPNMYEEMQSLANVLQSDIGQDMRVHNSTFLWFVPFVQSVMDLKDLGVAYIVEVIHHLYSEIKDILSPRTQQCDKVTELFILVLVSIIELHRNKKCLHFLWVSSHKWVEAIVKCTLLPTKDFKLRNNTKAFSTSPLSSSPNPQTTGSVQYACIQLIRSLLREGYQLGQQSTCKQYLDKLNLVIRGNISRNLELGQSEVQGLQACLRQVIKSVKDHFSTTPSSLEQSPATKVPSVPFIKTERVDDDDDEWYGASCSSPLPALEIKSCSSANSTEASLSHLKKNQDGRNVALDSYSSCSPTFSPAIKTNVKKETSDSCASQETVDNVSAEQGTDCSSAQQGLKPKRELSSWQSKLSKVMEKASKCREKRDISVSENQTSCNTENTFVNKSLNIKREPINSDGSDSDDDLSIVELKRPKKIKKEPFNSDNFPVTKQLEKLSLDNRSSESNSPVIKTEIDFDQTDKLAGKMAVIGKSSEDPQDVIKSKSSFHLDQCNDHVAVDDDDNIPLSQVKINLLKKKITKIKSLTNVQVNLEPCSLVTHEKCISFPKDSGQETMISLKAKQIERKVKGTKRTLVIDNSSSSTDISSDQIITISDSSSEEEETKPNIKTEKTEIVLQQDGSPSTPLSSIYKQESEPEVKCETSSFTCNDYDSQCFEFETEDEIFSVWEDFQVDQKDATSTSCIDKTSDSKKNFSTSTVGFEDDFNQWGYDTDDISDDVIERAAEAAEEEIKFSQSGKEDPQESNCDQKTSKQGVGASSVYSKDNHTSFADRVKMSSEKYKRKVTNVIETPLFKKPVGKKSETVVAQKIRTKSKTNLKKSPLKAHKEIKSQESHREATPVVVPPKKIRTCQEPTSTVEKLGLKKAPRKAFDLSQRSLDSVAELRNYGKYAGFVEAKRPGSKLISPQSLLVKSNKNLLACQDLQFYRQSRTKGSGKPKQGETGNNSRVSETAARQPKQRPERGTTTSGHMKKKISNKHEPCTSKSDANFKKNSAPLRVNNEEISRTANTSSSVTQHNLADQSKTDDGEDCDPFLGRLTHSSIACHGEKTLSSLASTVNTSNVNEDSDDENLFLTQPDPIDMEICSQVDNIEIGVFGDSDIFNSVESSSACAQPTEKPKCKYKDCSEDVKNTGDHCHKHTIPEKADGHVFAIPGLPPSLKKTAKPTTTKLFSAGNPSRTASLTKELENISKFPVSKAKLTTAIPSIPRLTVPPSGQSRTAVPQNTNGILQPLNQNIIPNFKSPPGKVPQQVTGKLPQQMDQAWLMREILQWKYEMFDQVSQFGVPNNLCQLPLKKVPLKFSGYEEYFNIFFPLMMLNTFESLVQDWSVKQKAISSYMCKLQLQNFCVDSQVNRGDFQAWIRDADLNRQRHPKEDDLVFLITPEPQNNLSGEEAETHTSMVYHTAYVSRFIRSQRSQNVEKEQYTLCDLYVHTYGNLSGCRNQQVQCLVIGSLITTQRQFKALLHLQRNSLFRPIIHPNPTDFTPRDNVVNEKIPLLNLREYNSDQKNAIEKAYAMVKLHPRLPRICLIHGPPGTGKSKAIVGLLYRILMEQTSNNVPNQNFNVKNKRNRVLVCAPSNAAIDDLMKKIILDFKEKCQDKKNAQGNCGDINLVRLGSEKTISSDVVKFGLDSQVNYRINRSQQDQSIHRQKEVLDRQLDELSRKRAMERCNKNTCIQLDEQICRLSRERQQLANSFKELRRRPQEVQRNIILEAHVVCCTLSASGGFLLESAFRQLGHEPFSCVIVDEAGQSCEVETIIPLLHRCTKLVLVGDPEQLPPTVISVKAEELGYGQSLMSRLCQHLENTGTRSPVLQLTVQYRMHPDICLFPSNYFYKRVLKTDRAIEEVRCSSEWPFQPYMVFDVADGYEQKERDSFSNPQEIKVVVALIKLIKSKMKEFSFRNIGVITPYRAQKLMIIDQLRKAFGDDNRPGEVDTVDGFQGRQKDCIIVTCVRANSIQGCIGFLASRHRLNVTITRAKFSLFILGSLRTLMENPDWNNLIQDAQKRGALVKTREEHYQKDVSKILKLKPVIQRPGNRTDERPEKRPRDNSSHTMRQEAPKHPNIPFRETNVISRTAVRPAPRAVVHPAVVHPAVVHPTVDCRIGSFPNLPTATSAPILPPAPRGKLRDPRLEKRLQAAKGSNESLFTSSPQSSFDHEQGKTQDRHFSSTAGTKRVHEPARIDSRSLNDGKRGSGSWSNDRDYRPIRKPEQSYDAKKRKIFH
ncbi:putative helicase senataxin [Discoglossus pictus]